MKRLHYLIELKNISDILMNIPITFILQVFQMNHKGLENDIQGLCIIKLQ